jgi:cytochrome c biogenesis protein CcdA
MVALGLATNGPLPIMASLVILQGKQPLRQGFAFVAGFVGILTLIAGGGALFLSGHVQPASAADRGFSAVNLLLGAVLIAFAVRTRVHSSDDKTAEEPTLLVRMRSVSVWGAAAAGMLLPTYPPAIAASTALSRSTAPMTDRVIAVVVFVIIASLSAAVPVIAVAVAPERSARWLDRVNAWLRVHHSEVVFWLFLVLGVGLVVRELLELV